MLNKKTVDDLKDLQGKKVLVRCDFNVPLKEGVIQNYNRIDGAIPTIKKLLDQGARVILCSHLGKPKGQPLPEMSLAPVAPALSERLGVEVKFADDPQVTGPETQKMAAELKDGEVLLLQNTRYRVEETKFKDGDAASEGYSKELAGLCDGIFVNDAFGTAHRAHCSIKAIAIRNCAMILRTVVTESFHGWGSPSFSRTKAPRAIPATHTVPRRTSCLGVILLACTTDACPSSPRMAEAPRFRHCHHPMNCMGT